MRPFAPIGIIAIVRGDSTEDVADVVTTKIAKIAGVTGCRTKIALRNYKPTKV